MQRNNIFALAAVAMIGMDDGSVIEGDTIEGDTYNEYNEVISPDENISEEANAIFDFLDGNVNDEDPLTESNPIWDDLIY